MPSDSTRFDAMINQYVHDQANKMVDSGRDFNRIEVTPYKSESQIYWEVIVHYHRPDALAFVRRLRHKSYVKH